MTCRSFGRRFRRDDDAVTVVIGTVLVLALITALVATVQVNFVPVWEENAEHGRMQAMQERFQLIRSDIDHHVSNRTGGPITQPLDLGGGAGTGLFSSTRLGDELSFTPAERSFTVDSTRFLVQVEDGNSLAGLNEQWEDASGPIPSITGMEHLRIRILDPASADEGDNVVLTLTDANGAFSGDLMIYYDEHPSGYSIKTRVRDSDGTTLFDQGESLFQQDQPAFWWVDSLAQEMVFDDVIAAALKPMNATFTENGLQGEYSAVYRQKTANGTATVGNSGRLIEDFTRTTTSGMLQLTSENQRLPPQRLLIEHGAVIRSQDDAQIFLVEPGFLATQGASGTSLRIVLPGLSGDGVSVGSGGPVSLRTSPGAMEHLVGVAPRIDINLTTSFPDLWTGFWSTQLAGAGLTAGSQYILDQGTDWAALTVLGANSEPSSTEDDLFVDLTQGTVRFELET